jgi:hypothetical protein
MNTQSLIMQFKIIQITPLITIKPCQIATVDLSLSPHSPTTKAPLLILNSNQTVNCQGRTNSKYGTINLYPRLIWFRMSLKAIGGKKKRYLFLKLKLRLINVLSLINPLTSRLSSKKRKINNSP